MSISRRNFMKLVGVSVSSWLLTRCRTIVGPTCYVPMPPSPTPTEPASPRGRLRNCWISFDELAQTAAQEFEQGDFENASDKRLIAGHRAALDELVAGGEVTSAVAELVQEAYEAAVYHVWRSNVPITCYRPVMVDYAPASASSLVWQAEVLEQVAGEGAINPATVERARAALERDMAFYALTTEEVNSLYERLIAEWQSQQQAPPAFEDVELEVTPDARAAARFIIELLVLP